jgi:hypothetical protein
VIRRSQQERHKIDRVWLVAGIRPPHSKEAFMRTGTMADPTKHVDNIRQLLLRGVQQSRAGIPEVGEPRAQALFETTAEVLQGLAKACEDYNAGTEEVWKKH